MKKRLFFLPVLFFAVSAIGQINDMAFAAVKYRFTHISDTTQPSDPNKETMVLLLGKNFSAYQSYDKMIRDSTMEAQVQEQIKSGSRNITIGSPGMQPLTRTIIYKEIAGGKNSHVENLMGNYLIDDPAPELNWSIEPDTKAFQELICQKATASFKGRHYTAWFCSQLPYSNGPWKLGGLPGLILEAYDDKKEVVFAFESFEDVTQRNMAIKTPYNTTKATQAEFAQLQEAFKKDPQGFMKTRMAGSGLSVGSAPSGSVGGGMMGAATISSVNVVSASGSGAAKKKEMNNPIEKAGQ